MISAKIINTLVNEQNSDDLLVGFVDDLYSYFKYQFQRAGCKVVFHGNNVRRAYAEFSLFYPDFSSLSAVDRRAIGLTYAKRLCKLLTKTEILHFKDSDFLTIYVSTLTRSVTDEIRFNDENSILEIVISTDGTDVPNAIVGGVYFASGLIDEGVLIRNIKTYTSPKFYGLVFQEIKKIIDLTAKAVRVTEVF